MAVEIGLISDTHGYLDPQVEKAFCDVDEIWHAGDFGDLEIARDLSQMKPFRGVYGNIDDNDVRLEYPEDSRFEIEGVRIWLSHIVGRPGRYDRRVTAELRASPPDVIVCGHTHICHVQRDKRHGNMLYMNPGAAGHSGFHVMRTLLKCRIANGTVDRLRVIELGTRGRRHRADSTK